MLLLTARFSPCGEQVFDQSLQSHQKTCLFFFAVDHFYTGLQPHWRVNINVFISFAHAVGNFAACRETMASYPHNVRKTGGFHAALAVSEFWFSQMSVKSTAADGLSEGQWICAVEQVGVPLVYGYTDSASLIQPIRLHCASGGWCSQVILSG